MAESYPCAGTPTGKSPGEVFDDADFRVYQMFHLCTFVSDLAGQLGTKAQVDELNAESIQVVFGLIADQLQAAREELATSVRLETKEIKPC